MPTPITYADTQVAQVLLKMQYRELARRGTDLPDLADVEFRCFSQNGEDGILLYLFSLLGTTNRRAVEICAGNGVQCNAANLILNHGWHGLLLDGDAEQIARGTDFYSMCGITSAELLHSWITADNVASLVERQGFNGDVDLLSLDLDGNDYWIWKALDSLSPRVVVLEFNAVCGPEASVAMSYRPDYRLDLATRPYRCGASLGAFVKLARTKGYRLVGVLSLGFNAFFVRSGLGEALLPERSVRDCYMQNERLKRWQPQWLDSILSGPEPWESV